MSIFANLFQPGAIGSSLGIQPFKPLEMMTPGGLAQMAARALPGQAGQLLNAGTNLAQTLAAGAQAPAGALTSALANAAGSVAGAVIPGAGALTGTLANAASALAGGQVPGPGALPGTLSQAASALGGLQNAAGGLQNAAMGGLNGLQNAAMGGLQNAGAIPLTSMATDGLAAAQNMLPAVPGLPGGVNPAAAGIAGKAISGQMPGTGELLSAMPATGSQPVDQAVSVAKALRRPG